MNEISNVKSKIEWCLKKGKTQRKHRGLRLVEPNITKSREHLDKAEHNLRFLEEVQKLGSFDDWIFSIAFYSAYHACLALLRHFGYESRNQTCTFIVMQKFINEKKINISSEELEKIRKLEEYEPKENMKTLREEFQYGTETKAKKELIELTVENTKNFVEKIKTILKSLWGEI